MRSNEALEYFRTVDSDMLSHVEELVAIDTPASEPAEVRRVLHDLGVRLDGSRGDVDLIDVSDDAAVLCARWGSAHRGTPQILLLGHADTVWPRGEATRRPFAVDGDRASGPGILDMKAGLTILVFALEALVRLNALPDIPIAVVVNGDEEIGSLGSRAFIESEAKRSAASLVLEPGMPDGGLKSARKGWGLFSLDVIGRASHAGAFPEDGRSAVEELARQILDLHGLSDLDAGSTVNVGVIHGGTLPNVIAAKSEAMIDVRASTQAEMDRILRALSGLSPRIEGTEVHLSEIALRPPMERTMKNVDLFNIASDTAGNLGLEVTEGSSGAASDGNLTSAHGVPTLDGLGAVGEGPHAANEWIRVSSLGERAALLAMLLSSASEWLPKLG